MKYRIIEHTETQLDGTTHISYEIQRRRLGFLWFYIYFPFADYLGPYIYVASSRKRFNSLDEANQGLIDIQRGYQKVYWGQPYIQLNDIHGDEIWIDSKSELRLEHGTVYVSWFKSFENLTNSMDKRVINRKRRAL